MNWIQSGKEMQHHWGIRALLPEEGGERGLLLRQSEIHPVPSARPHPPNPAGRCCHDCHARSEGMSFVPSFIYSAAIHWELTLDQDLG